MSKIRYARAIASCAALTGLALLLTLVLTHSGKCGATRDCLPISNSMHGIPPIAGSVTGFLRQGLTRSPDRKTIGATFFRLTRSRPLLVAIAYPGGRLFPQRNFAEYS